MSHAKSYAELREMSTEDLIQQYDALATRTQVGTRYYLEEIRRRDAERINQQMLEHTRHVKNLTIAIAILTVINVIAVIISVAL